MAELRRSLSGAWRRNPDPCKHHGSRPARAAMRAAAEAGSRTGRDRAGASLKSCGALAPRNPRRRRVLTDFRVAPSLPGLPHRQRTHLRARTDSDRCEPGPTRMIARLVALAGPGMGSVRPGVRVHPLRHSGTAAPISRLGSLVQPGPASSRSSQPGSAGVLADRAARPGAAAPPARPSRSDRLPPPLYTRSPGPAGYLCPPGTRPVCCASASSDSDAKRSREAVQPCLA